MAKTPWRCSQCGTINEPAANSCRTCGRWPSLFDLQDSAVGEVATDELDEPEFPDEPEFDVEPFEPEVTDLDAPAEPEVQPRPRRWRAARLVVPVGVLIYIVLSTYFSNR